MNVSELARQLKMKTNDLFEILPQFGFDIGKKAIKVDDRVAQKIIGQWKYIKREIDKRKEDEAKKKVELEKLARKASGAAIKLAGGVVAVKDFAEKLGLSVTKVIGELMKNGILATQNENIDFDTACIIAGELGFSVIKEDASKFSNAPLVEEAITALVEARDAEVPENLEARPPVIVVMGHVDHGKTKLLDTIRKTNVIAGEAGGITQHIGAYQVLWQKQKPAEKKYLTFIDTPGHEAFSIMRSRGAKVADIAVLVVAADDSVKPQTVEALNIIRAAHIPFVVAINKIDKEGVNIDKVLGDLSQNNVTPEEWGGDVPVVRISAKNNLNIDKLLDVLILVADVNEEKIKANPNRPAMGTVIESHVDKGEGPVATVLVQAGTLRRNDALVIGNEIYGKVRAMRDSKGDFVESAPPSTPVRILGFKVAPLVGDILDVGKESESKKINIKDKVNSQKHAEKNVVSKETDQESEEEKKKFFPIVVKTDVLGSLEAIIGSVEKIQNPEVGVKIIGKGLGNITEDDVKRAEAAGAAIYGFNVHLTPEATHMIKEKTMNFKEFSIIYNLINDIKDNLEKLLNPEVLVNELGRIRVLKIFVKERKGVTLGGIVETGKGIIGAKARIKRGGEIIGSAIIESLQAGKNPVKEVASGSECGIRIKTTDAVDENDIIEMYSEETKAKKLILG